MGDRPINKMGKGTYCYVVSKTSEKWKVIQFQIEMIDVTAAKINAE